MGMVSNDVVFLDKAPNLPDILAKITELSGFSLSVKSDETNLSDNLFDFYAQILFNVDPDNLLTLYAQRNGALTEWYEGFGEKPDILTGLDEPIGTQEVSVQIYMGQEPTLFYMTLLALESLGGSIKHPLPDDIRQKYGKAIVPSQLAQRSRKNSAQVVLACLTGVILLPILIPVWIFGALVFLIRLPKIIREAIRNAENKLFQSLDRED